MMEFITSNKLIVSILLLLLIVPLKLLAVRVIKRKYAKKGEDKRYLINNLRNLINVITVIMLFVIWSTELQRFAFSIAAFIVAIVLATKEIIQCIIGFIYLSSTQPFRIGDWIQIDDMTGEVAETDWAKVTLHEVDLATYSYTGRSVFLPNSQFMTQPIRNLNYMKRYVNHNFRVVKEDTLANPFQLKAPLLEKAKGYCKGFIDVAERYNSLIQNRLDIKISGPAPSINISTTELGKIAVSFELFCPTHDAVAIQQKLTEDLLFLWDQAKTQAATKVSSDHGRENTSQHSKSHESTDV
ncbi:mechanosensitive ion channel family protein [Colwellia sp. MEBiC06753]